MLVDVVPLRHNGKKLPAEATRAATPVRGELTLSTTRGGQPGAWKWSATRARLAAGGAELLPTLHDASVSRIDGDDLVIVGTEVQLSGAIGCSSQLPQAWWCRLVSAPGPVDRA